MEEDVRAEVCKLCSGPFCFEPIWVAVGSVCDPSPSPAPSPRERRCTAGELHGYLYTACGKHAAQNKPSSLTRCERLRGNGKNQTSMCHYIATKKTKNLPQQSPGSTGDCCWVSPAVSSTRTDVIAAPELGELGNLGKCQGNAKVPERCVLCCAVLSSSKAQVCEDTT